MVLKLASCSLHYLSELGFYDFHSGPAQGIVGPNATTLSDVYSYTLNINRIFI